jgi:hypothetical protein
MGSFIYLCYDLLNNYVPIGLTLGDCVCIERFFFCKFDKNFDQDLGEILYLSI